MGLEEKMILVCWWCHTGSAHSPPADGYWSLSL